MTDTAISDAPPTAARDRETRAAEAGRDEGREEARVTAAVVTIARPRRQLYDFWRDFSNLARVMENIETIVVHDDRRSTWTVKAPAGRTVSWDAEVTEDRPGELIAWQSAGDADIRSSGRIEFHDAGDRGSIVRAVIAYDPPAGLVGALVAKLFQREPAIQARRELRRFKQYMETGEVSTSARTRAHAAAHRAG